jgi:hypothetical protein
VCYVGFVAVLRNGLLAADKTGECRADSERRVMRLGRVTARQGDQGDGAQRESEGALNRESARDSQGRSGGGRRDREWCSGWCPVAAGGRVSGCW